MTVLEKIADNLLHNDNFKYLWNQEITNVKINSTGDEHVTPIAIHDIEAWKGDSQTDLSKLIYAFAEYYDLKENKLDLEYAEALSGERTPQQNLAICLTNAILYWLTGLVTLSKLVEKLRDGNIDATGDFDIRGMDKYLGISVNFKNKGKNAWCDFYAIKRLDRYNLISFLLVKPEDVFKNPWKVDYFDNTYKKTELSNMYLSDYVDAIKKVVNK